MYTPGSVGEVEVETGLLTTTVWTQRSPGQEEAWGRRSTESGGGPNAAWGRRTLGLSAFS